MYKSKARGLLQQIARHSDVINCDTNGTVFVHNQPIPGSNIVDILHSIVRARKLTFKPVGWYPVMAALKTMNIPREYISNNEALRLLGYMEKETPFTFTAASADAAAPSHLVTSTPIAQRLRTLPHRRAGGIKPTLEARSDRRWESFNTSPPKKKRKRQLY